MVGIAGGIKTHPDPQIVELFSFPPWLCRRRMPLPQQRQVSTNQLHGQLSRWKILVKSAAAAAVAVPSSFSSFMSQYVNTTVGE